jgi:3-hydroxyacyl-CoA dehydrogenase/enoyl-CoA hydratase/3-hydroxybutyryl-CoA epimerase
MTISWNRDSDGVVLLTLDDPSARANTMNAAFIASLHDTVERLVREREEIAGIVVTSAKKTFFAGGNLGDILAYDPDDTAGIARDVDTMKKELRRLETLGKPVVAAINGAALGGGLEIALATHHRIVADLPGVVVGLPEVTLGLLPGVGGIIRTVRMLGVVPALHKVLLSGRRFTPREALEVGLVDDIVRSRDDLVPAAKAWIVANSSIRQPWDRPGYRVPGSELYWPAPAAQVGVLTAQLRAQTKGAPVPAARAIIAAAVEGALLDIDTAGTIETRYFVELARSPIAKNLIQSTFFDLQAVNAGKNRPSGIPLHTVRRLAVLGAGMMGAGIAYLAAKAGIEVILKDVSVEAAQRGKAYSENVLAGQIEKGRITRADADELLARITPTADDAALAGADAVIEAVFESVPLKQEALRQAVAVVEPDALLASNTSTLPITELAAGIDRPTDFLGMHFFSPADKMPLLEIIVGERTSDITLARAFDLGRQLGKTPIVVNDSRGFFTSRTIIAFLNEAIAAVGEGVPPQRIEQAALQAGYPAGPLQLADELSLTLLQKITQEAEGAAAARGESYVKHGSGAVIDTMIERHARAGRSGGSGFYDYDSNGRRTRLWSGLHDEFGQSDVDVPLQDLMERMLFAEALEATHCLDAGVLHSVRDANVGSLLGIGYPAWTGGVLQYINAYPGGVPGFVARSDELAGLYGEHFRAPASLIQMASSGQKFQDES